MARTILLTGAAGFIGSHAAVAFVARGDRVVGLDNFNPYYDPLRKRANVREIASEAPGGDFRLVEGDLRDKGLVLRLFAEHRFDAVVHLGAMAGVRASVEDPVTYYDVNLGGTLTLLEAARASGCSRFVFASTSSAYGATVQLPFREDDPADRPLAPYPASKRAAELLGHAYHHLHGISFAALRFFTVYGPRGRPDMLTYRLVDAIRTGVPLQLYEGGRMIRDWTFVGDTVAGIVAALDAPLGYEVINLGRGEPVLVSEYVGAFERITGRQVPWVEAPKLEADVERTHADIAKARRLLGYEPRVSVNEGAARVVEWYERAVAKLSAEMIEPRLIAISDRTLARADETLRRFERLARAARPRSVLFQLRDHDLSARERLDFGRSLRTLCTAHEQLLAVNDRCDLAVLLAADALHLGERSVAAADARRIVGPELFVSRACHDPGCELEPGVSAWVLSPVFEERKGRAALGVEAVRRLGERCRAGGPSDAAAVVFALGGVTARNVGAVLAAGAFGVAVTGAVLVSDQADELVDALAIRR